MNEWISKYIVNIKLLNSDNACEIVCDNHLMNRQSCHYALLCLKQLTGRSQASAPMVKWFIKSISCICVGCSMDQDMVEGN